MAHFRKKPIVVEAITFEEFIEFGKKANPESVIEGIPWHFIYKGHPVTHENDECYLIPTMEGIMTFTKQDVLITGIKGEIYPCKIDIFEKTYESDEIIHPKPQPSESNNLISFGQALLALKEGKRVSRLGWNGKGMFLVQAGGYSVPLDKLREGTHFSKEFLESQGCTEFKIVPHIDMWAADKTYVTGWLASQTDMQANDWCILD